MLGFDYFAPKWRQIINVTYNNQCVTSYMTQEQNAKVQSCIGKNKMVLKKRSIFILLFFIEVPQKCWSNNVRNLTVVIIISS